MIEEHLGSGQIRGPWNRTSSTVHVLLFAAVVILFLRRIRIRAACSYESYNQEGKKKT